MAAALGKSLRFIGGEILRWATWAATTKAATIGYEQGTVMLQGFTPRLHVITSSLPDPTFSKLLDGLMVASLAVVLLSSLAALIVIVLLMRQINTGQKRPTKRSGRQSKSAAPTIATGTSRRKSSIQSKRSRGSKSARRTAS